VSGPTDNAHRLARRIEEATDRRYRIRTIAEYDDAATACSSDAADLYFASEHDRAHLDPAYAYFAGLPFSAALAPADLENWLTIGGGQELWDELAAEHGVKPLLAGHLGRAPRLWSIRTITSLGDFQGLRVAAYGPARDVMHALGAETVAMPARGLGAALKAGTLDAAEFGGALQAMASGVTPAAHLSYEVDPDSAGTALTLGVSRRVWDGMSQSDKTIFAACASEAYRTAVAEADTHEPIILSALCNLHGVSATALPSEIRSALPPIAEAVVAMLAAASPSARRINASYMAFRRATDWRRPESSDVPLV
jgi:TRAP-type mannitol/chloroaromatic compound transport system substrate-binding protein